MRGYNSTMSQTLIHDGVAGVRQGPVYAGTLDVRHRGIRHYSMNLWSIGAIAVACIGVGYGLGWRVVARQYERFTIEHTSLTSATAYLDTIGSEKFVALQPQAQMEFILHFVRSRVGREAEVSQRLEAAYKSAYGIDVP